MEKVTLNNKELKRSLVLNEVLAETYDPLWTASGPDFRVSSMPLYGVINGFAIEETGSYEIVVEYQAQQGARLAVLVTAAAIILLAPLGLLAGRRAR
jgi:hypothetical protein